MTITTLDGFFGATRQQLCITKLVSRSCSGWGTTLDIAGNPGAGTAAGSSSANGVVPTTATTGCPTLNAYAGGATGYLVQVNYANNSSVACQAKLFDMLFKAGTYAFASGTTTLSAQPSFSARCDSQFTGTQIWVECTTTMSGTNTVTVNYTNGAGTTGRATAANALTLTVGNVARMVFQAGDCSVSKIESVVVSGGAAGAINVLVIRPLWTGGTSNNGQRVTHNLAYTGMPIVYPSSALAVMVNSGSSITGTPDLDLVIASG